jgi:hypothetical protein
MKAAQVVGPHDPDKARAWAAPLQGANHIVGVAEAEFSLDARDVERRMVGDARAGCKTFIKAGQPARVLERVARRHEPPDAIKSEAAKGQETRKLVPGMGRIERTAEQADPQPWRVFRWQASPSWAARPPRTRSHGRVCPVPRTR